MTDDPEVCLTPGCGHADMEHDDSTGMCLAPGCRCICLRTGPWWDEEEDDMEELDFGT